MQKEYGPTSTEWWGKGVCDPRILFDVKLSSTLKANRKTFLLNKKIYHLVHFLGDKKYLKGISISVCEGVLCIRITLTLKNCESWIKYNVNSLKAPKSNQGCQDSKHQDARQERSALKWVFSLQLFCSPGAFADSGPVMGAEPRQKVAARSLPQTKKFRVEGCQDLMGHEHGVKGTKKNWVCRQFLFMAFPDFQAVWKNGRPSNQAKAAAKRLKSWAKMLWNSWGW